MPQTLVMTTQICRRILDLLKKKASLQLGTRPENSCYQER